jgi:glycine/D-amino acid oxidase-like deaminating enzyme
MKTHARIVVIGSGIHGCSILYHLAKDHALGLKERVVPQV